MKGLNKVELIGRLGRDPEMRYTPSGQAVTNFSIATDRSYTKDGEKVTQTEWHNITAWAKLAEIVQQYCKKGQLVYVEGRIQTDKYEKDGQTHYATKIVANDVIMLSNGNGASHEAEPEEAPAEGEVIQFA